MVPSIMLSSYVPLQAKKKQTMMLPPPCFGVGMGVLQTARCSNPRPNMSSIVLTKKFDFTLVRPQNFLEIVIIML